jgi:hypothetical protein
MGRLNQTSGRPSVYHMPVNTSRPTTALARLLVVALAVIGLEGRGEAQS